MGNERALETRFRDLRWKIVRKSSAIPSADVSSGKTKPTSRHSPEEPCGCDSNSKTLTFTRFNLQATSDSGSTDTN